MASARRRALQTDHRVNTDNNPHSVTFSFTSESCGTVGACEACDNRLRCKVRDEPVDQLLFGFLENGVPRQRAGHGEACSGPPRVAVMSMSIVCSQWLPQACWLELGACDETGTSFPHTDSRNFTDTSEIPSTLILQHSLLRFMLLTKCLVSARFFASMTMSSVIMPCK